MNDTQAFTLFLKNTKILYVEDDREVNSLVSEVLGSFTDYLYTAFDGKEAWQMYEQYAPDVIISDIEMPKINGIELINKIREVKKDNKTQVIFSTAYSDERYLLKAANLNIQGYIIKPITYQKLKDILKKLYVTLHDDHNILFKLNDDLQYDLDNGILIYDDEKIKMNNKERKLISLLIENRNKVVFYEEIENKIWTSEDESMSDSALRTLIKNIRKKSPTKIIENVSKQGYKIIVS
ncbi:MAG: response regulator transcription factor [Campylobacterota bacterium]|nr:response regulator transcription factor [Campylobacterota bacterium]